jgi:hypothetical protein
MFCGDRTPKSKKVRELDQLSELLRLAHEKKAQGMDVEIAVRIKKP